MDSLDKAYGLKEVGHYSEALRAIDVADASGRQTEVQVLKAELLEWTGHHTQARALSLKLLNNSRLTTPHRAIAENILARVRLENGEVADAILGLQRAMSLSEKSGDLRVLCWTQCKLLGILAEQSGRDCAVPLLADLRRNTTKFGNASATAQAHLFVAEMEGRQGHLDAARRHVIVGQGLLQDSPNTWLSAYAENVLLAVSLLESSVDDAESHSQRALALSETSGATSARRAAAANTGNLLYLQGKFDEAYDHFDKALRLAPSCGERNNAILDAIAQVQLAQNKFEECGDLLEQIDRTIRQESDRSLYSHRHAEMTRTRLRARHGNLECALDSANYTLELSDKTGDRILKCSALLAKAELLQSLERRSECLETLREVALIPGTLSPETLAHYESIAAVGLVRENRGDVAKLFAAAARSVLAPVTNVPVQHRLDRLLNEVAIDASPDAIVSGNSLFEAGFQNAIHLVGIAFLEATRPEVAASVLAEALINSGCAIAAKVVERKGDGTIQVLRVCGVDDPASGDERTFEIGGGAFRSVLLIVKSKANGSFAVESTMNLIGPIVERIKELQKARVDAERRAVLWPIEDLPAGTTGHVLSGHMHELMLFAQRVARTTVNVLITGESGTGKEILARAIHDFSDRASKPFVPFNCAAVPRDLLESQLFGHRRGAFTGAERDQLGLIRSAADGTLFLDEVGEMSTDLQPKLLRFLESGEIAPLGEPSPFTVNVRVVAATNANLDDAVRDGKFREDLFYRLNVVRLAIKPLRERRDEIPGMINHFVAAAAREFNKGHLEVSEDTMERLLLFRWPGNVRQLQNEVRRMVALAEPHSTLGPEAISPAIIGALPDLRHTGVNGREVAIPLYDKLMPTLSRIEYEMIKAALREHHGRVDPAAKSLGISRKGLYLKRQRLGL